MNGLHASWWLLPDDATRRWCERRMTRLRVDAPSPAFEAHVTLCSGRLGAGAISEDAVRAVAEATLPLQLTTAGYGHSRKFTRAFVVEFVAEEALHALRAALAPCLLPREDASPYAPHLSLLYGQFDSAQREALATEAPPPPPTLIFDRLALMTSATRIRTAADVEAWETPLRLPLGPAGTT